MKDHPILISGEMVRAILDGRKTQTRRVIKPQPDESVTGLVPRTTHAGNVLWSNALWETKKYGRLMELDDRKCPYGFIGGRLWVRETFAAIWPDVDPAPLSECTIEYRADKPYAKYPGDWPEDEAKGNDDAPKWGPSIHMPRAASRITLEITDLKAERVNDISEEDAIAEGLYPWTNNEGVIHYGISRADVWEQDPRITFRRLWDSINAKRGFGWDTNPWVWAITFKQVQA